MASAGTSLQLPSASTSRADAGRRPYGPVLTTIDEDESCAQSSVSVSPCKVHSMTIDGALSRVRWHSSPSTDAWVERNKVSRQCPRTWSLLGGTRLEGDQV